MALSLLLSAASLFGATTIQSAVCSPLTTPVITAPTTGDIEAGATFVSGTSDAGSSVAVKIDSHTAATVTADSGGTFGATITLTAGNHDLTATASNACTTETSDAVALNVTAPAEPSNPESPQPTPEPSSSPQPQIPLPAEDEGTTKKPVATDGSLKLYIDPVLNGSTVNSPSVYVSGSLSAAGRVTILRGSTILAKGQHADTVFGFRIPLKVGKNELTIRAKRGDIQVEATVTITRTQPAGATGEEKPWYKKPITYVVAAAVAVPVAAGGSFFLLGAGRRQWLREVLWKLLRK